MTDIQTRMIEDDYLKVVEENLRLSEANAELVEALKAYGDAALTFIAHEDHAALLKLNAAMQRADAILAKHEARDA